MSTLRKKGISLVVQWLRFCASNAGGTGSIPGWRIDPTSHETKKKKKERKKERGKTSKSII